MDGYSSFFSKQAISRGSPMIRILLSSIALAALIIVLPSSADAHPRKYKHNHKLKKTAEATSKKTPELKTRHRSPHA